MANNQQHMITARIPDEMISVPNVVVSRDELIQYAGKKCKTHHPECASCVAWQEWECTGKITVLIERDILLFGH